MYATRLKAVMAVLAACAAVLVLALFNIQVLEGSRYRVEAEERLKRPPGFHPTVRGTVYDRRGVPLAIDTGAFDVAVYFPFIELTDEFVADLASDWGVSEAEVRLRVEAMWAELTRLAGVPPEELDRRLEVIRERVETIREAVARRHGRRIRVREETYGERTSIAHPIVPDCDLKAVSVISSQPERFPGLVLLPARKRDYPLGDVAPHVIGTIGEVSREDLDGDINVSYPPGHLKRYWPGDMVGRTGVEAACEAILRGERGVYQKGIDGDFLEDIPPVPGGDVHLTLDAALQTDVQALLDAPPSMGPGQRLAGAAVVLDVRTGEVLVLASAPKYDLQTWQVDYPDLLAAADQPLVHRAIAGQYPLGSICKAVTATAALHEGVITPGTLLRCDGVLDAAHPNRFRCHIYPRGHGDVDLHRAIVKSCNVFFYRVGARLGHDRLVLWAQRLGLGRPTGIGLPGEAGGNAQVHDPRNLAVGQGELLVTPLQAAQLYGLVATDGRMPPLRLVREWPIDRAARVGARLKPALMEPIRAAFAAVVNEPGGTGYGPDKVTLDSVRVAGKTGTAQAGPRGTHAWFAGFAPAEDPRISFAVIAEHAGHGGVVAGPIAREIVRACQAHGYLGDRPITFEPLPAAPDVAPLPMDDPGPNPDDAPLPDEDLGDPAGSAPAPPVPVG